MLAGKLNRGRRDGLWRSLDCSSLEQRAWLSENHVHRQLERGKRVTSQGDNTVFFLFTSSTSRSILPVLFASNPVNTHRMLTNWSILCLR